MGTLETAEFLKTYKGQLRIGIFWFRDSYRNTGARMLKTLSFLLFSSLLISSCTALPASQDRFFLFNNPLCQQRVRTQCATQCLSQEPSAIAPDPAVWDLAELLSQTDSSGPPTLTRSGAAISNPSPPPPPSLLPPQTGKDQSGTTALISDDHLKWKVVLVTR